MGQEPLLDLSRIYDAYRSRVVACATRLLGRDDAEDVAQEVFVKVGRGLGGLSEPSKLGPWIYAITLNTVRDVVRRRASRPDRAPVSGPSDEQDLEPAVARLPDTRSRTPEETLIRNEMLTCYLDYVQRLPPKYYEVYALSEFEDLDDQGIARRLCLSLATVKIRLHRARVKLREELRRDCQCYYDARGELMGEPKRR